MKAFLFILAVLVFFTPAKAVEEPKEVSPYSVYYEKSDYLKPNQAKVTFVCDLCKEQTLQYGINGSSEKCVMSAEGKYSFVTTPQKGIFQFYYHRHYEEITTDSIELKAGMETIIGLRFKTSEMIRYEVEKPVIYLYPEVQTNVSVTINPVGKMTFTYPEYNDEWNATAQPNGELNINGKIYPYLFWEAQQTLTAPFSDQTGFIVKKENAIAFLEEKLTAIGLNAKEQTDFITYWGPRMVVHDQCKVKFMLNEQCDQFAELNILPKPDHINRVYIVWGASGENEQLSEQQLPVLNRDGFDVLEWGGSEITTHSQFHASTH